MGAKAKQSTNVQQLNKNWWWHMPAPAHNESPHMDGREGARPCGEGRQKAAPHYMLGYASTIFRCSFWPLFNLGAKWCPKNIFVGLSSSDFLKKHPPDS